jgi:hypothetical protein
MLQKINVSFKPVRAKADTLTIAFGETILSGL